MSFASQRGRAFSRHILKSKRCIASLPEIGVITKPSNLFITEVKNLNFYRHLCEDMPAFVRDVLQLKVRDVSPGKLTLEMAFHPDHVGNPRPATMHGGVIAAAIDHAAGFCCWTTFDNSVCSTMNLRIDYLKPLLLTDQRLILDAVVEHIDDENHMLRATVVCYNSTRSKQVAVGRALFNRYTPKLGPMEHVKPWFWLLWGNPSLNFIAKNFFDAYKVVCMYLHERKFQRKTKSLPSFSIEDERANAVLRRTQSSSSTTSTGGGGACSSQRTYNGLTEEQFIHVAEKDPVFGEKVLGLRVLSIAPGECVSAIAYKDCFTGNFVTAAMHGGVMAALIDQTAGMCARSVVEDVDQRVSTVDLSVDYLAPAKCFEHIICEARVASGVSGDASLIFVDAICWNEGRTVVIGVAKLTFNVYQQVI